MNRLVKYGLAAIAPLALGCTAARAEVTLCNDFPASVSVALGAEEGSAVYAAGWYVVAPNECKTVDFPFSGASLYYTADSSTYRTRGAFNKDHWGNKVSLFIPRHRFHLEDADTHHPGTRPTMFGQAVVSEQLRGKPVSIMLRFSSGNTTVSMKAN